MRDQQQPAPRNIAEEKVAGFYDAVGWETTGGIYEDARRSEDLREHARGYVRECRLRPLRFIPERGENLLEVGSGPIQYPEYLVFSRGFRRRYCNDLSAQALEDAKRKLGEQGVILPGSFFDLELEDDFFDCTVSLHVVYHMDAAEQEAAVRKMLRVTKPGKPVIIVYSNPNTILRRFKKPFLLLRRMVQGEKEQPLYFHSHPIEWWYRFEDEADIEIVVWRSLSSSDQKRLIPDNRLGEAIFNGLFRLEDAYPEFFARHFQYPMIVLTKRG